MKKNIVSMEKQEWGREPDRAGLERAATLGYSEIEPALQSLIAKGSVLAMVNLGSVYEFRPDEFGGRDLVLAEHWYRKAIEAGSAAATLPVGYFYFNQKKYEEAKEIFEVGAERGYAPAIVRLSHLYTNGLGVAKDDAKAAELLLRAAKLGNLWARLRHAYELTCTGNYLKVPKGFFLLCVAGIQLRYERRYRPWSEKLKK